jgi:hypothetical protein
MTKAGSAIERTLPDQLCGVVVGIRILIFLLIFFVLAGWISWDAHAPVQAPTVRVGLGWQ